MIVALHWNSRIIESRERYRSYIFVYFTKKFRKNFVRFQTNYVSPRVHSSAFTFIAFVDLNYVSEKCSTELATIKTPQRHKIHQLPIAIKGIYAISGFCQRARLYKRDAPDDDRPRALSSCMRLNLYQSELYYVLTTCRRSHYHKHPAIYFMI